MKNIKIQKSSFLCHPDENRDPAVQMKNLLQRLVLFLRNIFLRVLLPCRAGFRVKPGMTMLFSFCHCERSEAISCTVMRLPRPALAGLAMTMQ
jgi:hypothetical protein